VNSNSYRNALSRIWIAFLAVSLLTGCAGLVFPAATPTPYIIEVSVTPTPDDSDSPPEPAITSSAPTPSAAASPTAGPSATPTATLTPTAPPLASLPTPTPLPTAPPGLPNRLSNPGFGGEGRPVVFDEVRVAAGWEPFYCAEPYTEQDCAERGPASEDYASHMSRPSFSLTTAAERTHGGDSAMHWWCGYAACMGGVFQTFDTTPGEICEVGAWVQSWSAPTGEGHDPAGNPTGPNTSELANQSDRDNSSWRIRVDPTGGSYPWAGGVLTSPTFGYEAGIYDQYAPISYSFVAGGDRATVFFEDLRLWPFEHNESFIDDAYAVCWTPDQPVPEPPVQFPPTAPPPDVEVGRFTTQAVNRGQHGGDVVRVGDEFWMYYTIAGDSYRIGLATSADGLSWTQVGDGAVFGPETDGQRWDSWGMSSPAVLYDAESGEFEMWYSSETAGGTNYDIGFGYATSPDGIHWTHAVDGPVITHGPLGMWNEERIGPLDVVKVDGVYYLYYSATTLLPTFLRQIGCAASLDGIHWQDCPGNPVYSPDADEASFEGLESEWPNVIYSDGLWLMAYTGYLGGQGPLFRIGLAASADGRTWQRLSKDPVIRRPIDENAESYSTAGPALYLDREAGLLWMWYGDSTAGWVTSTAEITLP
jgi:predicted GH43/DUF377 family glycosyl hydrolase